VIAIFVIWISLIITECADTIGSMRRRSWRMVTVIVVAGLARRSDLSMGTAEARTLLILFIAGRQELPFTIAMYV
jgi:hypothetical protein